MKAAGPAQSESAHHATTHADAIASDGSIHARVQLL